MAYGMKIADEYGNTAFDSSSQGGVFVQFAVFPPGQSGFIALPSYLYSMVLTYIPLQSGNHTYETVRTATTSGSGYVRIGYSHISYPAWESAGATLPSSLNVPTVLMVLAK